MFLHVVGTRPNFMKLAPVWRALEAVGAKQLLLHTGQHYDIQMSEIFFQQLDLPMPDINLNVGSASHAQQTAEILKGIEAVLQQHKPNMVIVYGDVNSTMAATLTAAKLGVPVAHVEAGLRSFDRSMPEELNRLVTDQLADLLLTPSVDADRNLAREGVPDDRIRFVGNVMIDTLVHSLPKAKRPDVPERYVLATLHRPSNVDDPDQLRRLFAALAEVAEHIPVVFPIHPRTRARLESVKGVNPDTIRNFHALGPQGYLEFLALQKNASVVVTDSGGIQEETTYLQVPCLTMRENTERPVTVEMGTNKLIGRDCDLMVREVQAVLTGHAKQGSIPPLWDGKAGQRIAHILQDYVS